ncbi:MAG: hypothetical protein VR65_05985 [Desulfobulbaceae bacterium BRH_c16a]|nr:MAG: hypothetical protein VR65_05985 [Desulfobulbaceae bacterium BRH_c16a]
MADLNLKQKVPKGYSYPLTIKEIKKFAQRHVEIINITYAGISPHDQIKESKSIWFGEVIASNENDGWKYQLRIYASRNSLLGEVISNATQLMIEEIQNWIEWNSKSLARPITFNRFYLSARKANNTLESTSSEHSTTGFINKKQ